MGHISTKKLKFKAQVWFLLIPMMKPTVEALDYWLDHGTARNIVRLLWMWNMFSVLLVAGLLVLNIMRNKHMMRPCVWLILGLGAALFIGTISTGAFRAKDYGAIQFFETVCNPVLLIIMADVFAQKRFEWYIQTLYYYLMLYALFTSLTIYAYFPAAMYSPPGMNNYSYYLLGVDNVSFQYAMNSFVAGVAYHIYSKNKLSIPFVLLYCFIFGAYVYCQAGAATVCAILLMLYCIIQKSRLQKIMNFKVSIIATICGMLLIIFLQNFSAISGLLALIGKDITFTGRIYIWTNALKMFPRHFIFGIGAYSRELTETLMAAGLSTSFMTIGHMHNVLLEILIKGGIVGLCFFVVIFYLGSRCAKDGKDNLLIRHLCFLLPILAINYSFEYRLEDFTFWVLIVVLFYGVNDKEKIEKRK